MTNRSGDRSRTFLLVLVAIWLAAAPGARADASDKPPNVVMIISDDQAFSDFGFMGHKVIRTPHLDKLASQSALFPRGYVPSSLCRPSLATLITGLHPHQHKITGNDPPRGTDRAVMLKHIRRLPTLPKLLAEKGYVSHQSGKWWEGSYKLGGFTAGMTHGDPKRKPRGRHGDVGLTIGRQGMKPVFDFIDSAGDKPFFVWYAPFLPHTPHNPPKRLLDKYTADDRPLALAKYYAMCEWFDETCGQLLDRLDEKKLAEDTLVVFVTDNGWIQRTPETRLPEGWRQPFAPRSKRSPYEGGVRTPIMLRWPGKIRPARYETLVSSIDLAPTILAAAGMKPPKAMPGIDLLQVAESGGKTDRDAIFGDIFAHDVVDVDDPVPGLQFRWCIHENWKLILPHNSDAPPELYNLKDDPHEQKNLAAAKPDVVKHLEKRINAWWPAQARRPGRPNSDR